MTARTPQAISLLAEQREALETMLAMNAAADVDRYARTALDAYDRCAREHLRMIGHTLRLGIIDGPYGTLGTFGPNGYAPAIADIIASAERFRALARIPGLLTKSRAHDAAALDAVEEMANG